MCNRAVQCAQSLEAAVKNQKEINAPALAGREPHSSSSSSTGVHQVVHRKPHKPPDKQTKACYRCGKAGHHASICRHKDTTCNHCGKKGHLQSVCLLCKRVQKVGMSTGKHQGDVSTKKVHQTRKEQSLAEDQDSSDCPLFHLTGSTQLQPYEVTMVVNNKFL